MSHRQESDEKPAAVPTFPAASSQPLSLAWSLSACSYDPPDEIIHGLYLGSMASSTNLQSLEALNIRSIVVAGRFLPAHFSHDLSYLHLDLIDFPHEQISRYFLSTIAWMEDKLMSGAILVHCAAGVSRSTSIVIAFLIKTKRWRYDEALRFVRERRRIVAPNSGFERQLRDFERDVLGG